MSIELNIKNLRNEINQLGVETKILLATKTQSIESIQRALDSGISLLGENKSQELIEKIGKVKGNFNWHFIGHLQSNKVKEILPLCSLIHSVDRFKIAQTIDKEAKKLGIIQDVLIQVNTSKEESKSGFFVEDLIENCELISKLQNINVCGLMTMAKNSQNPDDWRKCFKQLRVCFLKIQEMKIFDDKFSELSMGMSRDYRIAIDEGSTIIRVGSTIFGDRS